MRTANDFFEEVRELKDYLEEKNSKTIFQKDFEENVERLYGEWQTLKKDLQSTLDEELIEFIDEKFESLLDEAKSSRTYVNKCKNHLKPVEKTYIREIKPKLSSKSIRVGFIQGLEHQLENIEEDKYREYISEATDCIHAEAYRGAIVLGWQALMFKMYKMMEDANKPISRAYKEKFNQKLDKKVNSFWDFQKIRDKDILILAEYQSIIDKSLKDMLDNERDLRNKAAHPGRFDVKPNNVKSFMENIIEGINKAEKV